MQQIILEFVAVHLRIYGYGLMLVLGFLSGIALARWRARRFGEDPNIIPTLGLLALVGGVAGARLAYVIEKWSEEFAYAPSQFRAMIDITSGGLIYHGGVALAIALVMGYLLVRGLPVRRFLDILMPSMMVGLAFGRAGCLLNGCCYGGPCRAEFPLAMTFPYASRPLLKVGSEGNLYGSSSISPVFARQAGVGPQAGGLAVEDLPGWLWRRDALGELARDQHRRPLLKAPSDLTDEQAHEAMHLRSRPVQPAQAYGIVNALLIAALLIGLSRLRRREGMLMVWTLAMYPVTRFVLESIRGDNPHNLFELKLTHNQYTAIGMIGVGVALWLVFRLMPASSGPTWKQRLAAVAIPPRHANRQRKGRQT